MKKLLVPALVLVTAALSSSNVLPILSINDLNAEPLDYNYQDYDNTYNNKHQTSNKLDATLYNEGFEPEIEKMMQGNDLENNKDYESISKDDNYNVKGFRKEQWHNYPRQLDRLNRYFYQHQSTDKRNLDPDDPGNVYADESADRVNGYDEIISDESNLTNNLESTNNEAEIAAAVINPLLIFRIRLACFNKDVAINQPPQPEAIDLYNEQILETNKEEKNPSNELNPHASVIKVKREDKTNLANVETAHEPSKHRTVNKRIFALFSRLQSLNPKGHQLHHRRHLYALYGPPDSEGGGGGVLTAETRATFMRPPGSPLRWG